MRNRKDGTCYAVGNYCLAVDGGICAGLQRAYGKGCLDLSNKRVRAIIDKALTSIDKCSTMDAEM